MTSALAMPGLFDTTPDDAAPAPASTPASTPAVASAPAPRASTSRRSAPTPPPPPPSRTVVQLLGAARDELRAAQAEDEPAERFRSAHLGALRAAAAVLALRARSKRSSRPTDAWTLLASVAPEYGEWAAFFAAHSDTRSAVEAGVRGRVSQRDADDMVRQADLFLALVTRTVAGRTR
ncbi:SAV_6107 family HEPN domain-containing protein [Actinomycetospora aeridis]|uniref:SAV_6107 family HEPN domain-containing protein n=1 Tax=Actinomycetospora aeridis TaxID=3129231 RepID=A0ABU8NC97_9PSEU